MGVVAMEVTDVFLSRGYPHVSRAVYVYCDACGSFRIRTLTSVRQWFVIIGGFLFLYLLLYLHTGMANIVQLMLVYILITSYVWGPPAYECKKCGALTSIGMNTRRYSANKIIMDAPDAEIVKIYLGYWPDMTGELDEYLLPPDEEQPKDPPP